MPAAVSRPRASPRCSGSSHRFRSAPCRSSRAYPDARSSAGASATVVQAIAEALIGGGQPGAPAPGGRRGRPALVRVDRRAAFMGRGIAMKNVASLAAAVAIVSALLPGAVEGARTGPGLFTLRLDGYVGDPPA